MKVKVKNEFKDKHTEQLHHVGEELELTVDRINEILKVSNLIELISEPTAPTETQKQSDAEQSESSETADQTPETDNKQEETADAGEQVAEAPKQPTRRKRSTK